MPKTMKMISRLHESVIYLKTNTLVVISGEAAAQPAHWDDMKGDLMKLFPLTVGSKEYNDVKQELLKTGLPANILSVCSLSDNN